MALLCVLIFILSSRRWPISGLPPIIPIER
jgi:hypothetical protein